jgi:hypothetical protein
VSVRVAAIAGLVVTLALVEVAVAHGGGNGEIGPSLSLTGNGHLLQPAGRMTGAGG